MKDIQLDLNGWIRYFLNGAIFILIMWFLLGRAIYFNGPNKQSSGVKSDTTLRVDTNKVKSFLRPFETLSAENKGLTFITLSLISGSVIYIFHRAILWPIIYRVFYWIFVIIAFFMKSRNKLRWQFDLVFPLIWVAKQEYYYDTKLWEQNDKNKHLSEWGSQQHFLFNLAWTFYLSKIIIHHLNNTQTISNDEKWLKTFFIITILSALISTFRGLLFRFIYDDTTVKRLNEESLRIEKEEQEKKQKKLIIKDNKEEARHKKESLKQKRKLNFKLIKDLWVNLRNKIWRRKHTQSH